MDTFLVVQRHQKRGEAINIVAHVAVIAAVAVCDEHIRRGDHCRENLLDCDVQVVPRFDVDGRNRRCFRTFAVSFDLDVLAQKFLGIGDDLVA